MSIFYDTLLLSDKYLKMMSRAIALQINQNNHSVLSAWLHEIQPISDHQYSDQIVYGLCFIMRKVLTILSFINILLRINNLGCYF